MDEDTTRHPEVTAGFAVTEGPVVGWWSPIVDGKAQLAIGGTGISTKACDFRGPPRALIGGNCSQVERRQEQKALLGHCGQDTLALEGLA